jgi:DNA-binding response OmpR family regulator
MEAMVLLVKNAADVKKQPMEILVIEDDPVITEFLRTGLKYEGYGVSASPTGKGGLETLRRGAFSLVVLDVMLPDIDGFEVCRRIRSAGSDVPVLMLTVRKEVSDRVKGLDSGADDYLTKPFSFDELLARIRALLRRSGRDREHKKLRAEGIVLDVETREVSRHGESIDLTPTEFGMLELFMRHPQRVFTRETLLNRVLGYDYDGGTNIIDVHISHLRNKLGDRPPRLIRTVYAMGYAFHPESGE